MSESVVSRWESGSATPSLAAIHRIADACKISISEFWAEMPANDDQVA
jgi:transcriptional regulator with XRE-family HTH domain